MMSITCDNNANYFYDIQLFFKFLLFCLVY